LAWAGAAKGFVGAGGEAEEAVHERSKTAKVVKSGREEKHILVN
jgi:hypothetical protein